MGIKSIKGSIGCINRERNSDIVDEKVFHIGEPIGNIYFGYVADGVTKTKKPYMVSAFINDYIKDKFQILPQEGSIEDQTRNFLTQMYKDFESEPEHVRDSASTFSAVAIQKDFAHCFWVGDSPIFHYDGTLHQISVFDSKKINEETFITDGFGKGLPFNVKYERVSIKDGHIMIVMTDGVVKKDLDKLIEEFSIDSLNKILKSSQHVVFPDDASIYAAKKYLHS